MQFISPGTPTASALHCLQWVNWGYGHGPWRAAHPGALGWGSLSRKPAWGMSGMRFMTAAPARAAQQAISSISPVLAPGMTTVLIFTVSPASAALATPSC